eukprot:1161963-Pelagomonas_calceolata.AAC.8
MASLVIIGACYCQGVDISGYIRARTHGTTQQAPFCSLMSQSMRAEQKLFAPADSCGLHMISY